MESFECAVCFQQFKDPRVISCGHTFCKSCLQKLKSNELLCPLCRRAFESVDKLPSNFVVLNWMEESKNQTIKKKDIICENCEEENPAVVWCENCAPGTYYCEDCDSSTHSGKVTRSHIRLSLKEKSKKPVFSKCKSHMEYNKVFCFDCKVLICSMCVIDDHPHKTMSIFKYGEILKNDLKNSILLFNEVIKDYNKKETVIDNEINKLTLELNKLQILLKEKKIEKEKINQQKVKIETSYIVITKSVEEMGVMQLMNQDFIELMKNRIKKIDEELCPIEVKERLEKERLEKERLEKERLEKERLEKERLEKERLEKERLEKERLEKERLEKERLEKILLPQSKNSTINKYNNEVTVNFQGVAFLFGPIETGNIEWNVTINSSLNGNWFSIGVTYQSSPDNTWDSLSSNYNMDVIYNHGHLCGINSGNPVVSGGRFNIRDVIGVKVDMSKKQLSFSKNGILLSPTVTFKSPLLYPIIYNPDHQSISIGISKL